MDRPDALRELNNAIRYLSLRLQVQFAVRDGLNILPGELQTIYGFVDRRISDAWDHAEVLPSLLEHILYVRQHCRGDIHLTILEVVWLWWLTEAASYH